MATNLEYLYDNDRRALADFVSCTDHCDDCRAREMCDRFTALEGALTEAQFLMAEMGREDPVKRKEEDNAKRKAIIDKLIAEDRESRMREIEQEIVDKLESLAESLEKLERAAYR